MGILVAILQRLFQLKAFQAKQEEGEGGQNDTRGKQKMERDKQTFIQSCQKLAKCSR